VAKIIDVAKAAGVSKGTVSNVFSGKRPISEEVKNRVLKIAKQLDYKPNYWARSLAVKQTRIIGINMEGEGVKFSQFHLSLLNGVLSECYENGYRLLVNTLSQDFKNQVRHQASDPVDGEILLDPAVEDPRVGERLRQKNPIVVVGNPPKKYESLLSYADNNNVNAAEEITEYLLSLDHKNILFLNAPKFRTVSRDREQGYKAGFKRYDIPFRPEFLMAVNGSIVSVDFGYQTAKQMLTSYPEITAMITDTDKMALGVYRAAAELGYKIPEDLSVVGFSDDSVYSPELAPSLTSVRLNGEILGREAAKLLIEQLQTSEMFSKRVVVPTKFIKRESCTANKWTSF
jgi:DNA-binding LacI/PurR family transcriptional regulator